ncbi:MAG TPA: ABC transporter permease [Patescibacteria group bacterium]|nr:ABC transporter permease [Patescibacteria group bacterium]
MEFLEDRVSDSRQVLALKGDWTVNNAAAIDAAVLSYGRKPTQIDASALARLDTAGAWLIQKYFPSAKIENLDDRQKALLEFVPEEGLSVAAGKRKPQPHAFFVSTGKRVFEGIHFLIDLFTFLGEVFTRIGRNFAQPSHFRLPSISRHIYETGIQAIPIIGLLGFGISMVISYQGATQLQKFGADIFTIDLTVISLLREMAVLTTAIMFAGRSGSAFAAEIGVMKMRGEVDALKTMGLDPIETLVAPRFIALLITLPALTFFADLVGLVGCALVSVLQLDISLAGFLHRVRDVATPTMFFIGMIKAPVFAILITAICTFQGMNAKGSAENVGKLTTLAVVQSIFLVIMADALFSIIFAKADL